METAHVLWTGGWDSTYRILDLALVRRINVQPHYLQDPDRESIVQEQAAMNTIRASALSRGGKIEAVRTQSINAITISSQAAEWHRVLRERYRIGGQYLWLSEYARQLGITELELCIHHDDHAVGISTLAESIRNSGNHSSADDEESPERLLSVFVFPLLDLTKFRMWELARANGFDDIMESTWFCHRPTRSGKPCGLCHPCQWTRDEGMGHRLPVTAGLRHQLDNRFISYVPGFRLKRELRRWLRAMG